MKSIKKQVLLPYSSAKIYTLVNNLEDYPNFLPWCGGVEIFEKTPTIVDAKIHINFKGIKQFFHTRNIQILNRSIDMQFVDGPFKYFHGQWLFIELETNACKVEFSLDYEFSNKILEAVFGKLFQIITNTFIDSFVKQAKKIYG